MNDHLSEINTQAEDMFLQLVGQMAEREGISERFKAEDQMEWIGSMNNIQNRAIETVNSELIFD